MDHFKKPGLSKLWTLGILLVFMLACSIPAFPIERSSPEMEIAGELAEAGLQETGEVEGEPQPLASPEPHGAEAAPEATSTPQPESPQPLAEPLIYYFVQPGTPIGLPNIWHKALGCDWMGVGGQVFGSDGWPEDETLVVELGGTIAGEPVSGITLTGTATQWGPSGYEFILGAEPVASHGTLWIQFYDLEGTGVSPRVLFNTYEDCEQNAILINMIHVERAEFDNLYLPVMGHMFFPGGH